MYSEWDREMTEKILLFGADRISKLVSNDLANAWSTNSKIAK